MIDKSVLTTELRIKAYLQAYTKHINYRMLQCFGIIGEMVEVMLFWGVLLQYFLYCVM